MQKLISFLLLFILFSCGGGGGTSVDPTLTSQTETITFKNVPENISIFE